MLDGSLTLRVNLPTVNTIHPQSNKTVTAVKVKASGDSKLNDSPDMPLTILATGLPHIGP